MTKLFITGATGYIGGDALYAVVHTFPDLEITALVRNSDKGSRVASQYSKIQLVYGDLDNVELLTTEASKADVVLHCADADHTGATNALVAGLAQRQQLNPAYIIHTSGTGILSFADFERKTYGSTSDKVYDDWDGIGEVITLPDTALHRNVDKIILSASENHPDKIFTAIVCPPTIYGPGRGPDNQKSVQAYRMAKAALQRGKGFQVEEGKNRWTEVHVQDLSNLFLSLVTAALEGGGKATWNLEGYYFAENGEFFWGDIGRTIARAAFDKNLIRTTDIDNVSTEEADKLTKSGSYLWGMNSRARAIRANKLFGWTPKQKRLTELIPEIVESEAKDLGLIRSHVERVTG